MRAEHAAHHTDDGLKHCKGSSSGQAQQDGGQHSAQLCVAIVCANSAAQHTSDSDAHGRMMQAVEAEAQVQ